MKEYLKTKYNLDTAESVSVIDELPLWSAAFGLKLLDTIRIKQSMKVLDIGFGLGFPMIEIAMRLGGSSEVYGIDPWEAAAERAKFKINMYGLRNVEITKGVAEEMPYEDNFFDLIVSNNGINNVSDIKKTLSECNRVTKKGAQFVFTMNLEETMIEFYSAYEKILSENKMTSEITKMKEQIYSKRKPLGEIESLVKESGFRINKIVHDNFFLRYTDGSAMLNHFLIKYGFLEGWINILPEDRVEMIFEQLEKKLNENSNEYGELKLSVPFVTMDCEKT